MSGRLAALAARPWWVLALVAAAYVGVLGAGFVWDDHTLVESNRVMTDPTWENVFARDLWCCSTGAASPYYRPVMTLSLLLDHTLWGVAPAGYHATNLALHLLAVGLVWSLAAKRYGARAAAVAALLFGLHPIQSEAVAWVAARNDLLCTAGILAGLWVLEGAAPLWLLPVIGLLTALSKESGVLLPVFGVLWLRAGGRWIRPKELALAALGPAVALAMRAAATLTDHASFAEGRPQGWADWVYAPVTYLGWLAVPWPLVTTASFRSVPLWVGAWPAAALGLGLLVWLARRAPWEVLLAAVAAAPVALALDRYGMLGERYLYLPIAALALGVARTPVVKAPVPVLGALAVGAVALLSWRLPAWKSDATLFDAARAQLSDGFTIALSGVGHEREGDVRYALDAYNEALGLPDPTRFPCTRVVPLVSAALRKDALGPTLVRWSAAGCRDTPHYGDDALLVLAQRGLWADAQALLDTHPFRDGSYQTEIVEGCLAEREGDLLGVAGLGLGYQGGVAAFRGEVGVFCPMITSR